MEPPKQKITVSGLRKLFTLYSYIKPYKYEYGMGLLFMLAIVPVIMILVVFFGRYIRKLSETQFSG
jgi:hypothetical protein